MPCANDSFHRIAYAPGEFARWPNQTVEDGRFIDSAPRDVEQGAGDV